MSYKLYGRMRGRGKELTASGSGDSGVSAQLETRNAAISVHLDATGKARISLGVKQSDTSRPERWVEHAEIDIDAAALAR